MSKLINRVLPIISLVVMTVGFTLSFITSKSSHAQSGSVLSGSCGLLLNRNYGGMEAHYFGDQTIAKNFIGIIDFDKLKISVTYNHVSDFGKASAVGASTTLNNQSILIGSGPFPGSFAINEANGDAWLILVPVNGGNTFIVSEISTQASSTGVCQRVAAPVVSPVL